MEGEFTLLMTYDIFLCIDGRDILSILLTWLLFDFAFGSTDEPGKQVSSAVKIKNTSRSPVAFKVCF